MTSKSNTTSKTCSTQSGSGTTSGADAGAGAGTATASKTKTSSAGAPPMCISCKKMILEEHYQKVFKPNGDPIPYHVKCLVCVFCKTVIEDHYVWHGDDLYHKHCSWQKMIADANKLQQKT